MLKLILAIVRARDTWLDVWRLFLFASAWMPQVITLRTIYKSLKVPYDSGHRAEWPHGARSSFHGGKMNFNILQGSTLGILAGMIAEDGPFDPAQCFMGLYTEGPSVEPPVQDTAFTFPLVAAFARIAVDEWSSNDFQPDGSVQVTSPVLDFTFTTFTEPVNFIGAYIALEATSGTSLKAWVAFEDFVQFLEANAHAKFVLRLTVFLDSTFALDAIRVDGE